jgi:hypothetical protein
MTNAVNIAQSGSNNQTMRNRIINGAMTIDQRNAGASVTPSDNQYTLDRWVAYLSVASKFSVQQNAGSVTPPTGFTNYLGVTSLSSYTVGSNEYFVIAQRIEGFNTADLAWGTANAQPVTLSFWVRSSLTGTFGGTLMNNAGTQSYPFAYTISASNTWEQKSITIPGSTTATWLTTNGRGVQVQFGLGVGSNYSTTAGAWAGTEEYSVTGAVSVVGTNAATFYITGVQLEEGTAASPFENRLYGTELQLCQRYFNRVDFNTFAPGFSDTSTGFRCVYSYPVQMRSAPTLVTTGTASDYLIRQANIVSLSCNSLPSLVGAGINTTRIDTSVASGLTTGFGGFLASTGASTFLSFSSEL